MDNVPDTIKALGELAKPATALIEKISSAVGTIYAPHHEVSMAKAKAEALKIETKAEIDIHDLRRRAVDRWIYEEERKQENIESISQRAIPLLDAKAKPELMSEDWIANFFDKSKVISDDEMQLLWAKVLAGEANSPGSFSKRTINLLESFDKTDADELQRLSCYSWSFYYEQTPLIFDDNDDIYRGQQIIVFETIKHLEDIGLISYSSAGYTRKHIHSSGIVRYNGRALQLKAENVKKLSIGTVLECNEILDGKVSLIWRRSCAG